MKSLRKTSMQLMLKKLIKKIGINYSLITCSMESSLTIQSIRQKSNEELPTSFASMGLFISILSLAFGCNAWIMKW